jgi:hypothetical protein
MSVRTSLAQCDYILSNDIILKSPWCDYVPKHSYQQQGRFRYICENPAPIEKPTIIIDEVYQNGDKLCLKATTDKVGNFINFKFDNGYETEIQADSLSIEKCIYYRKIGNTGTVTLKAINDIGNESIEDSKSYERLTVSIPALFYPLSRKVYARIVSTIGATVKIYLNNKLRETYTATVENHMFYSDRIDLEKGILTAIATKDTVTGETKRGYNQDWKTISIISVNDSKVTYIKPKPTIKIPILEKVTNTYFDGVDIGIDIIGVK